MTDDEVNLVAQLRMGEPTVPNMEYTPEMTLYLLNTVDSGGFMTGEVPETLKDKFQTFWWEKVAQRCSSTQGGYNLVTPTIVGDGEKKVSVQDLPGVLGIF